LWISSLAGLRGVVPAEIMNACGSLAWQAQQRGDCEGLSGPEGCGPVEILQACAGLRGMAWGRSCVPVDIRPHRPEGNSPVRSCMPEGWDFGRDLVSLWIMALAGLRSRLEDQRSHCLWSSWSSGLWAGAWRAALAVLLLNHDVEKTSMS
jgi:hypothetical protein